jgi:hypothetical protein
MIFVAGRRRTMTTLNISYSIAMNNFGRLATILPFEISMIYHL